MVFSAASKERVVVLDLKVVKNKRLKEAFK